jgi:hypothetical protein
MIEAGGPPASEVVLDASVAVTGFEERGVIGGTKDRTLRLAGLISVRRTDAAADRDVGPRLDS